MDFPESRKVFLPDQQQLEGSLLPGLKEVPQFCPCNGFDYTSLVSFIGLKLVWKTKEAGGSFA